MNSTKPVAEIELSYYEHEEGSGYNDQTTETVRLSVCPEKKVVCLTRNRVVARTMGPDVKSGDTYEISVELLVDLIRQHGTRTKHW